jgi:hypothetical protein
LNEDLTASLPKLAPRTGFRGIDTRKHYFEAAVGEFLAAACNGGLATRDGFSRGPNPTSGPERQGQ